LSRSKVITENFKKQQKDNSNRGGQEVDKPKIESVKTNVEPPLLEELKNVLKTDERFVSDNKLLKNMIVESALKLDPVLIKLLLDQKRLKEQFFTDIDGVQVFNKEKFMKFVENKEFLPNSYTAFKNKIGLTAGKEYLATSKEVVLSWPYKDCILEGGQEKTDERREEIFHNEVLAPDEIDRLLDPKVFTNFKRIDAEGEHKVTEIKPTDNLIIKGNNLLVLHSLKKRFAGKVKLIYIDPPYNTGSDTFGYNDNFNHSTWLTFMKNRLEVAKEFLRNDGIIFISIGDEEQAYLKVLCDEIFKGKFVATIPRKTRSGKSDVPYNLSQDFDWLLVYSMSGNKKQKLFKKEIKRKYYASKDFPNEEWRLHPLTKQTTTKERPHSDFTIVNPKTGEEYPVNPDRCWCITKDTFKEYYSKGKIVFPGDYPFLNISKPMLRVFKSEEIEKKGKDFDKTFVSSAFLNQAMDDLLKNTMNLKGTAEIIKLFGRKAFPYPKPELLLKRIIEYTTEPGDIILDFFLGSGTTCAVAHKMGRQYIGIEQLDEHVGITIARMKKVIAGEPGGISEEVHWKGGGEFVYCELKELNEGFVQKINKAKDTKGLLEIWETMKKHAFLSYRVDPNLFDKNVESFKKLAIDEQKTFLIECLDANSLYVNYSEMEDKQYGMSKDDIEINKKWYSQL
jgi:adenine-specific DNA-methyltransferase